VVAVVLVVAVFVAAAAVLAVAWKELSISMPTRLSPSVLAVAEC